jgi:hypothetical protein
MPKVYSRQIFDFKSFARSSMNIGSQSVVQRLPASRMKGLLVDVVNDVIVISNLTRLYVEHAPITLRGI